MLGSALKLRDNRVKREQNPRYGPDALIDQQKWSQLDRLYQRVVDDLDALVGALGLKAA